MVKNYLDPADNRSSRLLILLRQFRAAYFIALMIVLLVILAVLVHRVGVLRVDLAVTLAVQKLRSPALDQVALFFTALGTAGWFIGASVVTAGYLLMIRKIKSAGIVILSLLSYPLNVYIKGLVDRLRPSSDLVHVFSPAGGFSFPSGHAMISMAVYGTIAYLLWVYIRSFRALIVTAATVLIFCIGLSRIYLGVHWFSDVFGGWLGGLIVLMVLIQLHTYLTKPEVPAEQEKEIKRQALVG